MEDDTFSVIRGKVKGKEKYCRIPIRRRRATVKDTIDFLKQNYQEIEEMIPEYSADEDTQKYLRNAQACILTALDLILAKQGGEECTPT